LFPYSKVQESMFLEGGKSMPVLHERSTVPKSTNSAPGKKELLTIVSFQVGPTSA
jgi:hypothetical protein